MHHQTTAKQLTAITDLVRASWLRFSTSACSSAAGRVGAGGASAASAGAPVPRAYRAGRVVEQACQAGARACCRGSPGTERPEAARRTAAACAGACPPTHPGRRDGGQRHCHLAGDARLIGGGLAAHQRAPGAGLGAQARAGAGVQHRWGLRGRPHVVVACAMPIEGCAAPRAQDGKATTLPGGRCVRCGGGLGSRRWLCPQCCLIEGLDTPTMPYQGHTGPCRTSRWLWHGVACPSPTPTGSARRVNTSAAAKLPSLHG